MINIYKIFRPIIFRLNPEVAHDLSFCFFKFFPKLSTFLCFEKKYKSLKQNIWNIDFENPVGMAAGYDKNAEMVRFLEKYGFGFIECGTVTPLAQKGNDKPRIFRLSRDRAIINRLGFNNKGYEEFSNNLESYLADIKVPLGVNIGKNKDTQDATADYLLLLKKFYIKARYITINISSPNTKDLRDLQGAEVLDEFLAKIMEQKNKLKEKCKKNTPILLKIAPDLDYEQQEAMAKVILKHKIDGIIISNTTIDRSANLKSRLKKKEGGLSGEPLFTKSNEVLKNFYKLTNQEIPIIGVGGISSAQDAYKKIRCGASLVQIYTGFIYEGFGLTNRIKKGLDELLKKDGFSNISQAIGIDVEKDGN